MNKATSNVEDIYPLSPMQAGMLFHALYDPNSPVHFVQLTWEIKGALNAEAFRAAWQKVVEQHPALRTSFSFQGLEKPLQVVRRNPEVPWVFQDWTESNNSGRMHDLQRYLAADKKRGFDLSTAPLLRLHLIRTGESSYYFVCSLHHILVDGWSLSIVIKDVLSAYSQMTAGQDVILHAPPPYKNYIAWLAQQDPARASEFWHKTLNGFYEPTGIKIRKEKSSETLATAPDYCILTRIPADGLFPSMDAFARRHQLTLNSLVLGAWALILNHYSGQDDVVFGTTVAGRPPELPGVEAIVGLFINTLPVRVRMPAEVSLLEWLQNLQREQFRARSYEYSQLAEVQRYSGIPAGTPLFETMVVFENYPVEKALHSQPALSGLTIKPLEWIEQTNLPLTLAAYPGPPFQIKAAFDRQSYSPEVIERLLDHLETVLKQIASGAGGRLCELSLLEDEEKTQILKDWNRTEADFPCDKCIHELFEAHARETPHALAVEYEDTKLTYGELDREAEGLAVHLRQLGVGPDGLVCICVKRSLQMMVGLMGILKAGGAYVPIDPECPQERMAFMLEDSRTAVLLTQTALLAQLPPYDGPIICLDQKLPPADSAHQAGFWRKAEPMNLAYMIYTSGSTGVPKGVQIQHMGLCNTITASGRMFHLGSSSRVAQVASFTFDASVAEIFSALTTGASLHLVNANTLLNAAEFRNLLIEKRITFIGLSPSLLNVLEKDEFPCLRTIGVGGEACSLQTAAKWSRGRQFVNAYAPTETTIFSTTYECSGNCGELVPVGKPIANMRIYILDQEMRLLPPGIPGELYVSGVGVARGYLNQADLTAERFIPNPFTADSGQRMYRTGDLGRWQADGNVDFLGRIDHQVKIRGFRIEIGEIEAVLEQHQDVAQTVVIVREDIPGEKRLAAYVSLKEPHCKTEKELKSYLAAKLPDYMVPSAIVELTNFPLTNNGKVDRRALPAPELIRTETGEEYVAPRTPTEELLEGIWAQVLGRKRVGIYDDFFELGGHSLMATQIASRVRHAWSIDLPLKTLFESPTIAGLAHAIDHYGQLSDTGPATIIPVIRDAESPLSFAEQRLWFLDRLEQGNSGYLFVAVRCKGKLDLEALERSLDRIVERHESLRTIFPTVEGKAIRVVQNIGKVKLEVIDLRGTDHPEQRSMVLLKENADVAFDLSRGPLLRVLVTRLDDEEHVLQLTMHHIISDGWSMGVLMREISACYESYRQGATPELGDLPVQYSDFASWQREWLQADALESQLAYWRPQLADSKVPQLPADFSSAKLVSRNAATETAFFDLGLTGEIVKLCRHENVTPFMLLLAAYQVLAWRYTGEKDVVAGTAIAGRNRPEIENLIGFFVNTLVIRTQVDPNESFRRLLKQVRETALAAYAHQDLPFEKLVDELHPDRELTRTPLFQVMFVYQNTPASQASLSGLELSPVEYSSEAAQFDLMLVFAESSSGLQVTAQYKTGLFARETIQQLLRHYEEQLRALIANTRQSLYAIPYFDQAERTRLLEGLSAATDAVAGDLCIHQLFEQQAALTPEAAAVRHNGHECSYRQLNERANQLAHYLRQRGVGPEVPVGICLERSLDMIIGMLAILKSGGAYVPLDPAYPADRLAFTLEDSGSRLLLTQQKLTNLLTSYSGELLPIDSTCNEIREASRENPIYRTLPENLAYVIYTSGSTGRPKGVAIRHSSAAVMLRWAHLTFSRSELAEVLASTSICFDLSVFEIFTPLTCGGAVVVAANALELPATTEATRVTLINTVPSAMKELVRSNAIPHSVVAVNLAGEALPADLVRDIYASSHVERVFNLYGPTEDTTYSTFAHLNRKTATVSIGRPIANTQAYVLDEWLQPVGVGIFGNLYLAGDGLARGYLRHPEGTAERFQPNSFSAKPGERMYETGDVVRWRSDGTLEFLGRKDNQVKLRGFRIELGEIEAVLARHPSVKECAVVVRERDFGEKQLAACVVTEGEKDGFEDALNSYLKERLPAHMVPPLFFSLDQMPLTPNGKVDRKSLSVLARTEPYTECADGIPATPEEVVLSQIWAKVLGLPHVGINQNFFQLGGDSILSIQIVAKANQSGLQITPRHIFENQTIAELARVARRSAVIQAEQGLVHGPVPLTPIQRWFFEQKLPEPHHYNQSVMLVVKKKLSQDSLEKVVAGLFQHHNALRMRFTHDPEGQWRQQNSLTEDFRQVVIYVDLSEMDEGRQIAELEKSTNEWQKTLDLENGPLARFVLFDFGRDKNQRLQIVIHHLVVDGVSWRILLEDLANALGELKRTGSVQLGKKTTSFQQWSQWLDEHYASSDQVVADLPYWQAALAGPTAILPVDFVRGENTVASADSIRVALTPAQTEALMQSAARAYRMQIQEVLLTALVGALTEWTHEKSYVLAMEGHGREEVSQQLNTTRTVGWFTTIFPFRLNAPGTDTGRNLKFVKDQLRSIPQRGLSYGLLRYLHPNPQVRESLRPLQPMEISFNYLGQIDQVLDDSQFAGATESAGLVQSGAQHRAHVLDITASVSQRSLQVQLFYSRNLHHPSTLERFGEHLLTNLRLLTSHCASVTATEYTPSDFPWVKLNDRSLRQVLRDGAEIDQIYPLTPMQEGMLFHTLAAEQVGVYFEQLTCILDGDLQASAFAEVWQRTIDRHEILRSRFAWGVAEQIVRVVEKTARNEIRHYDWRELPQQEQEQALQKFLHDDLAAGFNVEQAPLMRLTIIRVEEQKHWLVWDFHHLVLDGWSMPIVLKDVFAAYRAVCNGREPKSDPPGAYQEYARWLQRQDAQKAENFWKERLKGFSNPIRLGVERREPTDETGPGDEDVYLGEDESRKLESFARAHHLTLNTIAQGIWALLLSRYNGAADVVFGSTISGRPGEVEGIEKLVGVFINTLPVRIQVSEHDHLVSWLQQIQRHQVEQRQFEYTSLADIQQWSDLPRATPLFNTIVVFENTPVEAALDEELKGSGLRAASLFRREQTNYPVEIMVTPGKKLWLRIIYARDKYEAGAASQILRHLRDLLQSVAANGNVPLSHLTFSDNLELPAISKHLLASAPLSHHQERLWFIDRFETGTVYESNPVYHNIPLALVLKGPVDPSVLERAIHQVIARHDSLQVRIVDQEGQPVQVKSASSVSLRIVEVGGGGEEATRTRIDECVAAECRIPFSLTQGPLIRALLLPLNTVESLLVIVAHHIVADGDSLRRIASEISEFYSAEIERRAPVLGESQYSYLDYAAWQRALPLHTWTPAWLYWNRQLGGNRTNLEIPTKQLRHAIHVFESANHDFSLPPSLAESIRSLARNTGTGEMQVLLAAFYALLRAYSGQSDFFVGLVSKYRTRPGREALVGPFANLLAFRCDPMGSTFSELLASVSQKVDAAYRYSEMPFELITQLLQLPKDMSRTVLFDALFDYDPAASCTLSLGSTTARIVESNLGYGKYDLNLHVRPSEFGLDATIVFNDRLYDRRVIERIARHYEVLLRAMTADPDRQVFNVPLLSEDERAQQLVAWNATQADFPRDSTIHRFFEEQVVANPDHVAVRCDGGWLSYLQLNERANQLAHHLQSQGVAAGMLVGVCMHRSLEMVVTIMAVLKAGGAYLPLDPAYPEDRLGFMLGDGHVSHLVTTERLLGKFAETKTIPWATAVDRDAAMIHQQSKENPLLSAAPRDLAYCIYTSGSTGQPNGVLVEHRNVVRLLKNDRFQFSFDKNDCWSLFHSYSFDFSVWEIFGALAYGASIVIVPSDLTRDSQAFLDLLCREGVTVLNQTPAAFYNLAAIATEAYRSDLKLRYVVFGGEALQPVHLKRWRELYPQVRLINMYGITETTVHVTFHEVTDSDVESNTCNIGIPIPTLQTYVMSTAMELAPVGVVGELCVGGDGVARGYMNRPQLTATRFIADPFSAVVGSRLYRSGDLARYREDGSLEYMGRIDHQVKIRGFRIELGEIETALRGHPAVGQVLVLARPGVGGEKQLVAYFVPSGGQTVRANELRTYLGEVLPDYMVPGLFVFLDKFPLTSNGKIDRKLLPEPSRADEEFHFYVEPRTPLEEMLCEVWADVLKVERVGVHDSFFELGGHSLLAMQLISRIRKVCQQEVELRRLFEHPTVASLALAIGGQTSQPLLPPIGIAARDAGLPLSFSQQRLWFLDQLDPGNNAFCMASALRLEGKLDEAALVKSLAEIVRRHESLRTRFVEREGIATQEILPTVELTQWFEKLDLRHMGEGAEAEAERLAQAASQIPFDLRKGPLLRVKLIQIGIEDHILLFAMHHIIGDGWSMRVLVREFSVLYEYFRRNEASPLPDLKLQYGDYSVWQRNWMQGEVLQQELNYWSNQLSSGAPLELPTDYPRAPMQQSAGGFVEHHLAPAICLELKRVAREGNATVFMVLMATYQVLLWRYTQQEDIAVGTPVANRRSEETEELIGFFVNTLVLRGSIQGSESFHELLRTVKETVLAAYAHQELPFERLVEELQPSRHLNQTPLFQVMLVVQNASHEPVNLAGLRISPIEVAERGAQYDLTLEAEEDQSGQLRLGLHYRRELFERQTAERMLGHYCELLEGVVADIERPIQDLPLLQQHEERQLLREWNRTDAPYPESCIQELFEQQAERRAGVEAVRCGASALSYDELNCRANQLARFLQQFGAGPEVLVGVCVERSLKMMVAVLGVVKSGGAYLPLDPAYPQERLRFMLTDSRMKLLVTQEKFSKQFVKLCDHVICIDRDWPEIAQSSGNNLPICTQPDNVAYIIYTSGSTGRPKAAVNLHRGICNLVQEHRRLFHVGEGKTVLQFSSLSFDAATWDWTMALLNGARLVIPSRQEMLDGMLLWQILRDEKVHLITLPPSVLEVLPDEQELPDLEVVVVAGESCPQRLAARWGRKGLQMHNAYGPSETTVCATASAPLHGERPPDIGSPIANAKVYILDDHLRPTPVGVPGEMYIGGVMLGRGYLNRPDLTAERFVANPFGSNGERLYKTGDRARWKNDGTIEFLGRLDTQVKLRGFRIELEELEAVLREHPAIEQAVAMAREDRPGDKRLVAYIVAPSANLPELRTYLGSKLPEYMVPAVVMPLQRLPLTPNGKIDRKALPAPDISTLGSSEYVAPSTSTEKTVSKIWAEVLGIEKVGANDNFFELGGHSLLATQVLSRIRKIFDAEVPLAALFEQPTVATLAEQIDAWISRTTESKPSPIVRVDRPGDLPLSFAQQRIWFLEQLDPDTPAFHVPVTVRLKGPLSVPQLQESFEHIVKRHEPLRTVFVDIDGQPVQRIQSALAFPLEVVDLQGLDQESQRETMQARLLAHVRQGFDLTKGPLARAALLRLQPEEHVLQLVMHHIATDGWSMGVLVKELEAFYNASIEGAEPDFEELPIQYADFACWQRQWMQSGALETQLQYWKNQLSGMQVTAIPTDWPAPVPSSHQGAAQELPIRGDISRGLRTLALEQGATLFMVIVSALQIILHVRSGSTDIGIGTDIANRNRRETEALIGFFVNTLILRTNLSGDPSFRGLIERVRETTLGAYSNQDLPFERLVEELRPHRDGGRSPLFRIKVTLQNMPMHSSGMRGLQLSLLPPAQTVAPSDMIFFLAEHDEGIHINLVYDIDLFQSSTAANVLLDLQSVLASVVENPDVKISALRRLLVEHSDQRKSEQREQLESAVYAKFRARHKAS